MTVIHKKADVRVNAANEVTAVRVRTANEVTVVKVVLRHAWTVRESVGFSLLP